MTVMPSNVYGIGDNFHPENSHVVAGMMYRLHNAKINNYKEVIIWGSGNPLRELIDADDLADACIFLMQNYDEGGMVNVGSSKEISIRELAFLLAKIINYSGELKFDTSRPDGTPRKIMDNSILEKMNWFPKTSIENGLNKMYSWFLENKPTE
jgi:GDP-L-fucose synthase